MRIRLGTRGSELALTQSGHVADALRTLGHEVDLVPVKTAGDVTTGSLVQAGGTGVFAAALRESLLAGEVDIAVHSFKDLPTAPVPGLVIAAVPERELPFDALCARMGWTLADLPEGARVGTGSPRRAAQLKARRPDLVVVEIRGNVGTRLARVHGSPGKEGDLDAVVLARAGLARLERFDAITEVLDLLPAPAQGCLAIECRADDADVRAALAGVDHPESHLAALAERAILAGLQAGCAAPIGALALIVNGHLEVTASVLNADGSEAVHARHSVPLPIEDPEALGHNVALELLHLGAATITPLGAHRDSRLEEFHDATALWAPGTTTQLLGQRILLPRPEGPLAQALRDAGADVTCAPLTVTEPLTARDLPTGADWLVLTSPTAVRTLTEAGVDLARLGQRVAVVGRATQSAVLDAGVRVDLAPCIPGQPSDARTLVELFPPGTGRVLVPGSELSRPTIADGLSAKGWTVDAVATYTTRTADAAPPDLLAAYRRGDFDAVVLMAGSTAKAVHDLLGPPPEPTTVVTFGRPSAEAAHALGFGVAAIAHTQDADGLVGALVLALETDPGRHPEAHPDPGTTSGSPATPEPEPRTTSRSQATHEPEPSTTSLSGPHHRPDQGTDSPLGPPDPGPESAPAAPLPAASPHSEDHR